MRQEDKKAFVEEYLALCRKYGLCVDSYTGEDLVLDPIKDSFETFENLENHMLETI